MTHLLYAVLAVVVTVELSSFATSIYLHRCLAHRGVKLNRGLAFLMRVELWLATGLHPKQWVAVHRKHHRHTDVLGDPHSPVLEGLWRILLANAYYYAREARNPKTLSIFAPDVGNGWFDRTLFRFGIFGLALGAGIFVWLLGPIWGGVAYASQAVIYVFFNSVINGANHAVGYQNFNNTATNLRFVAMLTAGEGLHNNHHAFPTSARFSVRRNEFDPSWQVLRLLGWLGLAKPLRVAPQID